MVLPRMDRHRIPLRRINSSPFWIYVNIYIYDVYLLVNEVLPWVIYLFFFALD